MLPKRDQPQKKKKNKKTPILYRVKVKGWGKNVFQANGWEIKARVAILISDKIDFKTKAIKDTQKYT